MTAAENVRVIRSGQMLTARVWDLIDFISETIGKPLQIVQGGFKDSDGQPGDGANASSGTHSVGDVFDVDDSNLTEAEVELVIWLLRYWNGCAWYRSPEHGWTQTGSHAHCVMRDSFYGLSPGAQQQVRSYDAGRDGLGLNNEDYHPRPDQHHFTKENAGFKWTFATWITIPALVAPFWQLPALLKSILAMVGNLLMAPVAVFVILYFVNRPSMGELKASTGRNVVLWITGLFALALVINGVRDFLR